MHIYSSSCLSSFLQFYCRHFSSVKTPTHSFFPGLKPSFSTNLSHCSPSFLFYLNIYYMDSPDCLLLFLAGHICFLLLVFFCFFLHFPTGNRKSVVPLQKLVTCELKTVNK